jgi:alkylhydroperoxidase/carboxymuconolactone decarboxylase family protein YurZ
MKMNGNPLETIREADAELFEQIGKARELAFRDGALSRKEKLLIALAIDAAAHAENGVRSLAKQALESGASREELMEALRVVNYICGAGSMYVAAAALKDVL